MTLGDLLEAHDGINDTISQLYPHYGRQAEEDRRQTNPAASATSGHSKVDVTGGMLDGGVGFGLLRLGMLLVVVALEGAREDLTRTLHQGHTTDLGQSSAALTDPQLMGGRVAWCVEAEQHMRSIVENKDLLIYHLQQPITTTFLTMHHKHHRSLVNLVGLLTDLMNRLPSHIDLLERYAVSLVSLASAGWASKQSHDLAANFTLCGSYMDVRDTRPFAKWSTSWRRGPPTKVRWCWLARETPGPPLHHTGAPPFSVSFAWRGFSGGCRNPARFVALTCPCALVGIPQRCRHPCGVPGVERTSPARTGLVGLVWSAASTQSQGSTLMLSSPPSVHTNQEEGGFCNLRLTGSNWAGGSGGYATHQWGALRWMLSTPEWRGAHDIQERAAYSKNLLGLVEQELPSPVGEAATLRRAEPL
ncbi:hypothetical protein GWK47_033179 [Chionoecetes opilio]|uniref:Uncharacterized protein n=1 Tax=Chionoecetes opilio TaxID=41210 RepID=A0A8J4YJW8_CHIOP|nr:hypothetical protein GWK47_033179 [Chionoecetes opilio]